MWGGGRGVGRRERCGEEGEVWGGGRGVGRRERCGEEGEVWGGGRGVGRRERCGEGEEANNLVCLHNPDILFLHTNNSQGH